MKKIALILILIFCLSIVSICEADSKGIIPLGIDDFHFESTHQILDENQDENQTEFFSYTIKGEQTTEEMFFEILYNNGKDIVQRNSISRFVGNLDKVINILNFIRFMELPELIEENNVKKAGIKTVSKFKVTYTIHGRRISKKVTITNLDELCEKNTCKEAFRLKYLSILVDFYKCMLYRKRL
jgi:hypothetical protein